LIQKERHAKANEVWQIVSRTIFRLWKIAFIAFP